MARPTVDFADQTIMVGTQVPSSSVFTANDADGDAITNIFLLDNNGEQDSSYFTLNGNVLAPFVLHNVLAGQLGTLVMHSGTGINTNQMQITAQAGGELSDVASALVYSVFPNVNRPTVSGTNLTVVQNEFIRVSDFLSASDPIDGHPIKRYKIFEPNGASVSGTYSLNGNVYAANQWHYVNVEDWNDLRFNAAPAAPNNDRLWIRAYDGELWSLVTFFEAFTTQNLNRPVVIPTEYQMATRESVPAINLFQASDADGNTLKKVRFFDSTVHAWSGHLTDNGFQLPSGQWIERDISALSTLEWFSAERAFNEQIVVQVFDGKHWSDAEVVRVTTNSKPVIGVNRDYSIRQQLEFVSISGLVQKLDDGPVHTSYEIFDANTDGTSGKFRLGAQILEAGVVHTITAQDFFDLEFKSGVFETRSIDEIYIRANNGNFKSDWTRHTIFTEPEYLDSLAAGSWLNFRTPQNGKLTLTFSFMQDFPNYPNGDAPADEFVSPWAEMRPLVRQAYDRMSEVINVDFEEVPDSVQTQFGRGGTLRTGTYCVANTGTVAYARFPGGDEGAGDMWFNRWWTGTPPNTTAQDPPCGFPNANDPPPPGWLVPRDAWDLGSTNYATYIHEFGHAMGLKHPFDPTPILPPATNSGFFSAMSYTGATFPERGPQLYDIAALQTIYGSNDSFNNTDTVYDADYFRGSFAVVDSIWDTGGWDIIDASDQITPVSIDLRPGRFQEIGGGTLSIAFETEIEQANGGVAGDTLVGNESANILIGNAGNDRLQGYGGDDRLTGGVGSDTYVYSTADGHDIINEQMGAGRDRLEISAFLEIDNFTDDVSFTRRDFDLIIDFTADSDISRGSVTIENQGFGRFRVETLDIFGTDVDLRYLFEQMTQPKQSFVITAEDGQYGKLVAPA